MTQRLLLFLLLLSLASLTAAGSPRKPIPPKEVHVCVQVDGVEDRWTFMTHETTTPVPGMALRKGIEKALWYSGKQRDDLELMRLSGSVSYATEPTQIRRPPTSGSFGDGKDGRPQRNGYDCTCATALYDSGKKFSGCAVSGCDGCYVCVARE